MSMAAQAKSILAEAIGIDEDQLPADAAIGNVEQWDSLAHMRMLLAIEEVLERELSPEQAVRIDSLGSMVDALGSTSDEGRSQ